MTDIFGREMTPKPVVYMMSSFMAFIAIMAMSSALIGCAESEYDRINSERETFKAADKNGELIVVISVRCCPVEGIETRKNILADMAKQYHYEISGAELRLHDYKERYSGIIYFKRIVESQTISSNQTANSLDNELTQFIARKNGEIKKLEETKQTSVSISSSATDQTIIVHIAAFIVEIDSRIEMIKSITAKAESFRKDVNDFEKVEQIRKWLSQN